MFSFLSRCLPAKVHHLIFWTLYYVFWVALYYRFYEQKYLLYLVTLFYLVVHAGIYYIAQYVLIPKYLKKTNIITFLFSLIGLIILSVGILYLGLWGITGENFTTYFGNSKLFLIFSLAFSNTFILAFVLTLKNLKDRYYQSRIEEKKEKERLQSELDFLKAQVNPHFLFNTINSIYVLIRKDPDLASHTLIKLSDLLRTQLYEFGTDKIDIEKETEYIENYLELEKIRKGDRVKVHYQKEETLSGFKIAPLLLIPFIENCFKHLGNKNGNGAAVNIYLAKKGKDFQAIFENTTGQSNGNNGPGGIGLSNVKRRLELLYPKRHNLYIDEQNHIFLVELILQIDE